MLETEFVVDTALTHSALLREDANQFNLKRSRCISQARARFVTMQHLLLWIKPLKPWQGPQEWDVGSWQVEVDLSGLLL